MTILKTTARETSCNRCVALSLGFVKDWFANNSSRYFRAIRQTISLR